MGGGGGGGRHMLPGMVLGSGDVLLGGWMPGRGGGFKREIWDTVYHGVASKEIFNSRREEGTWERRGEGLVHNMQVVDW